MLNSREGCGQMIQLPNAPKSLKLIQPRRTLNDVILSDANRVTVRQIVREWKYSEKLSERGLTPRNVLMLQGPSGNGKTSLAEAMAGALGLPFAIVYYPEIIDSYRGQSLENIASVFAFCRTTPCVVFFDEADSVVQSRMAGARDSGAEDNRSINGLLMELDRVPPTSFIIFATNFRAHLDVALTRRLAVELELGPPENGQREQMIEAMQSRWPFIEDGPWIEAAKNAGSYSAIESLAMDAAREACLEGAA
jgi:SpoVK/Ycf46/Vps4 family AAA+-type ATPase